ncbi:hypothetical protein [Nocardioides sp.]|uniref:hypothetical protein n=1 Tax=Nocardioides sp. TaxID=35761 RepID=UPI0031FE88CC|nr:hypothetical protein [Nocardioides sp.]
MSVKIALPSPLTFPVGATAGRPAGRRLLQAFPWLTDRADAPARLALIPVGFLPVTLIAAAAFGVAGLRELASYLLVPALALVAGVLVVRPKWTSTALRALGTGIVATALYDVYRGSFLALGLMQVDPIPHIGTALHLHPAWAFGYLWRYLGNGGGMAVAFFALGLRGVRIGILYGLFVCSGLLFVLVAAPYGQEMLFPLNPTTVIMAVGGHIIYGAALGWLAGRTVEA